MTRPMVHFQIRGRDQKRLEEFYAQLFGWKIAPNAAGIAVIEPGIGGPEQGVGGSIVRSDEPGMAIYVQVVDLHETLRRAEELGGKAILQPVDVPEGPTVAQCADPEGNLVGLVKQ